MGKRKWEEDESIQASARAAVTLNCMNSKFRFLYKAKSVLDLCAATGGWMHVAVGRIPQGGLVLGVDLSPVKIPAPDAITIQGDVNSLECRNTIRKIMAEKGVNRFDVVMRGVLSSDPHATVWDQASVLAKSIRLATKFLAPEGSFVTKMFNGAEDYNPMLYCLEQLFSKVVVTKPTSRSTETYIVALGYKAPEKVDRHLLVPRNLFVINEDMPREKKHFSGETTIRIRGTTVIGVIVKDINGQNLGIVFMADGLLTGSERTVNDTKVKGIGMDILCGMAGDYDFTESVSDDMDRQVWAKLIAKKSRQSVEECASMLESWYSDYLTQKDEKVDRQSVGKDYHAFMILGGYEDMGGNDLVPHLWYATKIGALREPNYCCIGSGAAYAEMLLKKRIKKCHSVAATVKVMEKCFLKSARYDIKTGGDIYTWIITPPSNLGAVRRRLAHKRIMGTTEMSSTTLGVLKTRYNDNFNDRILSQTYPADRRTIRHQKKKGKKELDSSISQTKINTSTKQRESTSAKKPEGAATKSDLAGKSKDSSNKSKDGSLNSSSKGSKSKDERSTKAKEEKDGKSKDTTPKVKSKLKESPKTQGDKVKVSSKDDATPSRSDKKAKGESNSKSGANGTSAAKKRKSDASSNSQEVSPVRKKVKVEKSENKTGGKTMPRGVDQRVGGSGPESRWWM